MSTFQNNIIFKKILNRKRNENTDDVLMYENEDRN